MALSSKFAARPAQLTPAPTLAECTPAIAGGVGRAEGEQLPTPMHTPTTPTPTTHRPTRCITHIPPFTSIDTEPNDRPGWIRSRCKLCGTFLGYRLKDHESAAVTMPEAKAWASNNAELFG
jgi:hypothetical protein